MQARAIAAPGEAFDVAVIGAGAAGLFAAARIGQGGRRVVLIEHAQRLGEKIRISGGGRCNFTNRDTRPENFLSDNPHFCRSALAGFTPEDFLGLLARHGISWHEKHRGQLFCDRSAEDIIAMLLAECRSGAVSLWQPCQVESVGHAGTTFSVRTSQGPVRSKALVIATGGLSIPKIGATDFGLRIARQFGHRVVEPRAALVPLTFDAGQWAPFGELAGVSLPVAISAGSPAAAGAGTRRARHPTVFLEDLLFTHRGLSGPAVLQASSYWRPGGDLTIDLAPSFDLAAQLTRAKVGARHDLRTEFARHLPTRLADTWLAREAAGGPAGIADWRDPDLRRIADSLKGWQVRPSGSEGWRKAEVMAGGVATDELRSQSLESTRIPGLYFVGEVVDVTGWLGGFNFQWAWASAAACARAVLDRPRPALDTPSAS